MTDAKLAQVDAPTGKNRIADCGVNLWLDWASRAAIVIVYGGFASIGVAGVPRLLPLDSVLKLLVIAASIANILFLSLVALTTITRLVPIQKSKGIEARISALLGTFLSITLAFLPKAELSPIHDVDPLGNLAFFRGAPLVGQILQHSGGGKALGDRRTLSNRTASALRL